MSVLGYETRQYLRAEIDRRRRLQGRPCVNCFKPVELKTNMARLCPDCKKLGLPGAR